MRNAHFCNLIWQNHNQSNQSKNLKAVFINKQNYDKVLDPFTSLIKRLFTICLKSHQNKTERMCLSKMTSTFKTFRLKVQVRHNCRCNYAIFIKHYCVTFTYIINHYFVTFIDISFCNAKKNKYN